MPVAPDISNMIPCRLTGRPFWDIYYYSEPPLWQAYLEAVDRYGLDGWFIYGDMQYQWPGDRHEAIEDMHKTAERWAVRYRGRIDGLRYHRETTYYVADPPTTTEKIGRATSRRTGRWWRSCSPRRSATTRRCCASSAQAWASAARFGVGVGYPGFQHWF